MAPSGAVDTMRGEKPPAELWNIVYSHLDATGGSLEQLANALHAADEAGFNVESDDDRRASIDAPLDQAFQLIDDDGRDVDPGELLSKVEDAKTAHSTFWRGLTDDLKSFELPDWVDSGVYDELGEYTKYVGQEIDAIEHWANEYAEAVE